MVVALFQTPRPVRPTDARRAELPTWEESHMEPMPAGLTCVMMGIQSPTGTCKAREVVNDMWHV